MAESQTETHRVIFHGRVQGVGFRWTTNRLAAGFPVNGFVRNLADGTVELFVQGSAEAISSLIAAIQAKMGDNITDCADDRVESAEQFDRFQIRR